MTREDAEYWAKWRPNHMISGWYVSRQFFAPFFENPRVEISKGIKGHYRFFHSRESAQKAADKLNNQENSNA